MSNYPEYEIVILPLTTFDISAILLLKVKIMKTNAENAKDTL